MRKKDRDTAEPSTLRGHNSSNDEAITENKNTNSASGRNIVKHGKTLENAEKNGRDKGENISDKVGEKRNSSFRINSVKDAAPKEMLEEKDVRKTAIESPEIVKFASSESMRIGIPAYKHRKGETYGEKGCCCK